MCAELARILVAQIGARRHYAVPRALHRLGLLERLATDACAETLPWRGLERTLPLRGRPSALRRILGRRVPGVPAEIIRDFPQFTLSGLRGRRRGEQRTDFWARRNADFCRRVVENGFGEADAVYCFNGAALEIFRAARDQGIKTILDQTAAPWRWNSRLLAAERERWPDWETEPAEIDVSGELTAREEAEWQLADRILCGSEFAAQALAETGGPRERCAVVHYPGCDSDRGSTGASSPTPGGTGRLRVLFVGTLQLRKGIQYLYEAKKLLRGEPVDIRLVGPSQLSASAMRRLGNEMTIPGPVPRASMGEHYSWADVFVLPTLSEGSANVCHEATAAGLPVITTLHAGSLIRDGIEGVIIPIRDAEALADGIKTLLADDSLRYRLAASAGKTHSARSLDDYASSLKMAMAP